MQECGVLLEGKLTCVLLRKCISARTDSVRKWGAWSLVLLLCVHTERQNVTD